MFNNLSTFQKRIFYFLVFVFLVQSGLIAILIVALSVSDARLQSLGNIMDEMAADSIVYSMDLNQDMPVQTNICLLYTSDAADE